MPPEVRDFIQGKVSSITCDKSDLWGAGKLICEILKIKFPPKRIEPMEQQKGKNRVEGEYPDLSSHSLVEIQLNNLLVLLCASNVSERLSVAEAEQMLELILWYDKEYDQEIEADEVNFLKWKKKKCCEVLSEVVNSSGFAMNHLMKLQFFIYLTREALKQGRQTRKRLGLT